MSQDFKPIWGTGRCDKRVLLWESVAALQKSNSTPKLKMAFDSYSFVCSTKGTTLCLETLQKAFICPQERSCLSDVPPRAAAALGAARWPHIMKSSQSDLSAGSCWVKVATAVQLAADGDAEKQPSLWSHRCGEELVSPSAIFWGDECSLLKSNFSEET